MEIAAWLQVVSVASRGRWSTSAVLEARQGTPPCAIRGAKELVIAWCMSMNECKNRQTNK